MTENKDEALKADGEAESVEESPTSEEQEAPKESLDKTSEDTESVSDEVEQTPEKTPEERKSASARIRQLNSKKKEAEERAKLAEEKAKSLAQQMAEFTGQQRPEFNTPVPSEPEPLVAPGETELDPAELERRMAQREQAILAKADQLAQIRLAQEKALERINQESQEVVKKYPQLDPDNKDAFDKELSESIAEATFAYVRNNPTGSVKKFVEKLMKPYQRSVTKKVGEQQEALAKQAAESAVKPTPSPKGEKAFSELSLKEMEERLGKVYG